MPRLYTRSQLEEEALRIQLGGQEPVVVEQEVTDAALTPKQLEVWNWMRTHSVRHTLFFGGSRAGKTVLFVRAIVARALKARGSRHAIIRLHANAVWPSIGMDTFPKVMQTWYPKVEYEVHKSPPYFYFPDKQSEIWLGGLDDAELGRVEKIFGREYATIFFNECSQIPYASILAGLTRLAQTIPGLQQRAYYDLNPVGKGHWTHKLFVEHKDPVSGNLLTEPQLYKWFQLSPSDNQANLTPDYIQSLEMLPPRQRERFFYGRFVDETENALWSFETIENLRVAEEDLPDMRRIVIAVDPSGAKNSLDLRHDMIGIVVAGLGVDGHGYLLADYSILAGPNEWGRRAVAAFHKFGADCVVAEINYGGAMVQHVISTVDGTVPFREVVASRGKVVRAEPISSLGSWDEKSGRRIHHVGKFLELENELCDFTTLGYVGERSPNRADAYVWAFSELMAKTGSSLPWLAYYKDLSERAQGKVAAPEERQLGGQGGAPTYGKPVVKQPKTLRAMPNQEFCTPTNKRYRADGDGFLRDVPLADVPVLIGMGCVDPDDDGI